jgi:hypothetical protein
MLCAGARSDGMLLRTRDVRYAHSDTESQNGFAELGWLSKPILDSVRFR